MGKASTGWERRDKWRLFRSAPLYVLSVAAVVAILIANSLSSSQIPPP